MEHELPVTASSVTTSAAMETAAPMEASAKARLPARGEASRDSSMIKAAECAGMCTRLAVLRRESMLRRGEASRAGWAAPVKAAGVIEVVAIGENSTVRLVMVMVETNIMVMPI